MENEIRAYDAERDADAVARIWKETRWIDDDPPHRKALAAFLDSGDAEVGTMNGEAECLVHRTMGRIRYDRTDLPLCAISGVTTSHIGRKQGLASSMTGRAVRHGATAGAAVSALGVFEQGFYDRFGFATGSPELVVRFDPASLNIEPAPYRPPERLGPDNATEMQECLDHKLPHHGQVTLHAPRIVEAEWTWVEHPFALGYRDEGRLTHFFAGSLKEENGPFKIEMISFETGDQLMELLRLLHALSDQIHSVQLIEPPEVQIHALLENPNRQRSRSLKGDHETVSRSTSWWQFRILDVPAVVAAFEWEGEPLSFDLELTDPITDVLHDEGWNGVAGTYRVDIGPQSAATPASPSGLPLVRGSVNAFTRLWFGVRPASALVLTGELDAPPDLCARLDRVLRLPVPQPSRLF